MDFSTLVGSCWLLTLEVFNRKILSIISVADAITGTLLLHMASLWRYHTTNNSKQNIITMIGLRNRLNTPIKIDRITRNLLPEFSKCLYACLCILHHYFCLTLVLTIVPTYGWRYSGYMLAQHHQDVEIGNWCKI